jgi:type II secretory pathway pseudopilin PulG
MKINNQKGAIFVLSLMVMMILVILSSIFIYRAVTEKNLSDRERKLAQALLIGESGANAGLAQLDTLIMLPTATGSAFLMNLSRMAGPLS